MSSAYIAVCILPDSSQVLIPFSFPLNFSGKPLPDSTETAFTFFANFSQHPAATTNDDPKGRGVDCGLKSVINAKEALLLALQVLL